MILNETFQGRAIIEEVSSEKLPPGVLCRVSYPICNIGERNANNRVYEASVWEKVLADVSIKEAMEKRCLFGHAEHPEQTQSNLEKTCHVIIDMWESDGKVWQKFDILDTPTGRIVDCLLRADCQVGCSTRAEGDLEEAEDDVGSYQNVITDSYSYKTTDFTADPSTQGSIPYDVKRNIVSEVKKMYETKDVSDSEKEFAQLILEAVECKDGKCTMDKVKELAKKVDEKKFSVEKDGKENKQYIMEGTWALPYSVKKAQELANLIKDPSTFVNLHTQMWNLYGTDVLYDDLGALQEDILLPAVGIVKKHLRNTLETYAKNPKSFSASFDKDAIDILQKLVEQKIMLSLLKEGIIKEGTKVKYDDKNAKVNKIEESKVTLLVGEMDPTTVAVDGNAHVNITPEGVITILSAEAMGQMNSEIVPEEELAVEPIPEELPEQPVEEEPIEDESLVDEPVVDVEDEIPEAKRYVVGDTVKIEEKQKLGVIFTGSDIGQKEHKPKYFDTEEEAKAYAKRMNAQLTKGEKEYYKLKYKVVEGKITKIKETGITVALDDGTTVSIEDPTAVNITVTPPAPEEEMKEVPEEKFPGATEEEVADIEAVEDELGEAKVATKGGVSDRLADGNLLQDKDGAHWIVAELTDTGLLITQPGQPGTEKSLGWDEVSSYGFTKLAEKEEEGVEYKGVVETTVDEGVKVGDTIQIKDSEGNTTPVPEATVHSVDQDTEGNLSVEVTGSEDEDKQQWYGEDKYQIILLKKSGEVTGDVTAMKQLGKEKAVKKPHQKSESKIDEGKKEERKVELEKLSTSELSDLWLKKCSPVPMFGKIPPKEKDILINHIVGVEFRKTFESISTTVKEIKTLKIQEASTRAERDKAVELLEELTDEKQQLEIQVKKSKAFEIKMLVNKIGKTLEVKEKEVDALRFKLEERAKFAVEQKKLVSEARTNSMKGITDLTKSIENKYKKQTIFLLEDHHKDQVNLTKSVTEKIEKVEEKKRKEACEVLQERIEKETTEKVTEEVTKQFIKSFVEFRLSESNLKVDENSRALLEQSTSLEDVDNLLDEILDVSRRGALHSEAIRGICVPKHIISDPEGDRIVRSVNNVFEGFGG